MDRNLKDSIDCTHKKSIFICQVNTLCNTQPIHSQCNSKSVGYPHDTYFKTIFTNCYSRHTRHNRHLIDELYLYYLCKRYLYIVSFNV